MCKSWKHTIVFVAVALCTKTVLGQTPVTVSIGEPQGPVSHNFVGMSFGMRAMLPDKNGTHFFSATNTPLITIFHNLGLSHLRMGGTTVESPPQTPVPDERDIDSFFGFVKAVGDMKVIYSFRLLQTNAALHYEALDAKLAAYIWQNYRPWLDCFAIGNEPNLQRVFHQDETIHDFASYLKQWRKFASAIADVVPEAKFAGPDAASANTNWTLGFADAEKDSGLIATVTEHFYVGGKGRGVEPATAIDDMLSPSWDRSNENIYRRIARPVMSKGLAFAFTEANDHYSGGVKDGSDTFAGALWALDFLHWWAAHHIRGVDFHNTQWVVNDVITHDADGQLAINPKGYGLTAFDVGGHGDVESVTMDNPQAVNLTAYAVAEGGRQFVTVINKEHGPGARAVRLVIASKGPLPGGADAMFLVAPNNDPAAKTGVLLGGSPITSDSVWHGRWQPVKVSNPTRLTLDLPPASAAIVRLETARSL